MSYVRGFLPWIAFAAVSGVAWQWAALLSLAIGAFFLVKERRAGASADGQILDLGTVVYFTVLTVIAFADPHSPFQDYVSGASSAWLALIAGGSLLVGRPFTLGIAKRSAPPALWQNPVFIRTSTVLAGVWTAAFTLSAIATLLCEATGAGDALRILVQILGFAVPMAFTRHYVKKVRARAVAAAATPAGPVVDPRALPATGR
ncbi:hypothetical protein [Streptomyces sp. DW26H14]|uniref:hypothetical protein n=1 Tax=Streptomyces sp. DW26H14 TaxID=3435395 RepID=UPI00403E032B